MTEEELDAYGKEVYKKAEIVSSGCLFFMTEPFDPMYQEALQRFVMAARASLLDSMDTLRQFWIKESRHHGPDEFGFMAIVHGERMAAIRNINSICDELWEICNE